MIYQVRNSNIFEKYHDKINVHMQRIYLQRGIKIFMKKSLLKSKVIAIALVLGFSVFGQMGAPVMAGGGNESSISNTTTVLKKIDDILNSLTDGWVLTSGDSKNEELVKLFELLYEKLYDELSENIIPGFRDNIPKNCNNCKQAMQSYDKSNYDKSNKEQFREKTCEKCKQISDKVFEQIFNQLCDQGVDHTQAYEQAYAKSVVARERARNLAISSSRYCDFHCILKVKVCEIHKLFCDNCSKIRGINKVVNGSNTESVYNKECFKKLANDAREYVKKYRNKFIDTVKNQNNSSSSSSSSNQE